MKKTQNFLEWNYEILISSLKKINLNVLLIAILDLLFYFLSGYLVYFWFNRMYAKVAAINFPSPADLISLGYAQAQQILSTAKTFLILLILSIILLIVAIIFLASILKGIIWAKTTSTKISFALISKFLVLNLIWMSFWFVLIFLIVLFIQLESVLIFTIAVIILGLFFTNTLYTIFMKSQKLKSIFSAIKLNIAKFHLFLLPYAMAYLLFYIIIRLTNLMRFKYSPILVSLIILIYAAVVRYYVSTLVLELEKL